MLDVYANGGIVETPYKIKFIKHIDNSGNDFILMRFEVTASAQEICKIDIKFSGSLMATEPVRLFRERNENYLLWWSWMKIKDQIDSNEIVSSREIGVYSSNETNEWIGEISEDLDPNICDALRKDSINYYPKKKLGFM
ncbi:hypothetical protein KAW50_06355 [candidate division WOR-3 bacterium]|nr:hypothetical protein [candidate division WOR-3 bacterium]